MAGVGLWEAAMTSRARGTISLTATEYAVLSLVVVGLGAVGALFGISMWTATGVSVSWASRSCRHTDIPLLSSSNEE